MTARPRHTTTPPPLERDAPVRTWFGIGGRADRLARPADADELRACLELDPDALVLGDGANLLVDDDGVGRLVVDLSAMNRVVIDRASGRVSAGAGVRLPSLIGRTISAGLSGLEPLAGIPASVGGAAAMNAGGRFGDLASAVERLHLMDRDGVVRTAERDAIAFGYRRSGLADAVVIGAELRLTPADPSDLRRRRAECMSYKAASQPLAASSAGCCFKNPRLRRDLEGVGASGDRVPAALLIDRAGGKGRRVGGAEISREHANFIVTDRSARARDVIELMDLAAALVRDRFGVELEREVVVWSRGDGGRAR